MTPREYFNACDGFSKAEENKLQMEWERARWMASIIVSPPKKMPTFPWEKAEAASDADMDEIERRRKERNK